MNSSGAVSTNVAIQHPNIYYFILNGSWSTTNNLEYWNKTNSATTVNNNTVYKTIYSPSPFLYSEPKTATYTGFSTTGANTYTVSQFNVRGPFNSGWNFYCQPNYLGSTIFFRSLGLRDTDSNRVNASNAGTINLFGLSGNYWQAGPDATVSYALDLGFNTNCVLPNQKIWRSFGFCMRSVLE